MAATGAVLACEDAVLSIREGRIRASGAEGVRPPPARLVAMDEEASERYGRPFVATAIEQGSRSAAVVRLHAGRERWAPVDPRTGEVIALGPSRIERFFAVIRAWHRWLGFPRGSERIGRKVTGAANLALLFLLVTGPLLWIPWPPSRRAVAANLTIGLRRGRPRGRGGRLRLHRAVGIWALLPLGAISVTGALLSFPSLGDRVYPLLGTMGPDGGGATGGTAVTTRRELDRSGGVLSVESLADGVPEERTHEIVRSAHTGEYWGLPGRVVAGIATLAALAMVWTGISSGIARLAIRKQGPDRRLKANAPPATSRQSGRRLRPAHAPDLGHQEADRETQRQR